MRIPCAKNVKLLRTVTGAYSHTFMYAHTHTCLYAYGHIFLENKNTFFLNIYSKVRTWYCDSNMKQLVAIISLYILFFN